MRPKVLLKKTWRGRVCRTTRQWPLRYSGLTFWFCIPPAVCHGHFFSGCSTLHFLVYVFSVTREPVFSFCAWSTWSIIYSVGLAMLRFFLVWGDNLLFCIMFRYYARLASWGSKKLFMLFAPFLFFLLVPWEDRGTWHFGLGPLCSDSSVWFCYLAS